VKIDRRIVAVATATLVMLGAGVAAAEQPLQPPAPKGAYGHKGPSGHKHSQSVKAPYLYVRPACTLLTCLTPVNTGP
jgi:hypothetical protein